MFLPPDTGPFRTDIMPPLNGHDGFTIGKAQVLGVYFVEEGGTAAGGTLALAFIPADHLDRGAGG